MRNDYDLTTMDLDFDTWRELHESRRKASDMMKNESESFIKNVCEFAKEKISENEFTKIFNDILEKTNWTYNQKRVIFNYLINNLTSSDIAECIELTRR